MEFEAFWQIVAEEAAARGIDTYELYYQREDLTRVSAFGHEITEFSDASEGGVSLRCMAGGHMGCASTEALTEESARALVRRAAESAAVIEKDEPEFLAESGQTYRALPARDLSLPEAGALKKLVLAGQDALYAEAGVVDGCGSDVYALRETIALTNSQGLSVSCENAVTAFMMMAVVADGEEKSTSYDQCNGTPETIDLAALAAKTAGDARAKLGAGTPPSGAMPVVFSPRAMADLLGTYAGIFSAENVRKGLSLLKDKEGSAIASGIVTLVDDPFYADCTMPMPFDAEGTPTFEKNVIEHGVLKTLLYDLSSAAAMGKTTTGNAARRSYADKISVRPFTLRLQTGTDSEDALLQKAGSGVYIDSLGGLHAGANPISGDFSLQSGGFLIEDGKKTAPVRSFTVAGNFFTLLQDIVAVADNPRPPTGIGSTAFVSPSVLVKGLSVAGK